MAIIKRDSFATKNGPFNPAERMLLQNAIEDWVTRNAVIPHGFDIAICAWQSFAGPVQILAGTCSVAEDSSLSDINELIAQKDALEALLRVQEFTVPGESDIWNFRMNDDYNSRPLMLILNAEGGRFLTSLMTWFNYVSVGKTLRFLSFIGNLLCQMRMYDKTLAASYARALGMEQITNPKHPGSTLCFSPELPNLRSLKA